MVSRPSSVPYFPVDWRQKWFHWTTIETQASSSYPLIHSPATDKLPLQNDLRTLQLAKQFCLAIPTSKRLLREVVLGLLPLLFPRLIFSCCWNSVNQALTVLLETFEWRSVKEMLFPVSNSPIARPTVRRSLIIY